MCCGLLGSDRAFTHYVYGTKVLVCATIVARCPRSGGKCEARGGIAMGRTPEAAIVA